MFNNFSVDVCIVIYSPKICRQRTKTFWIADPLTPNNFPHQNNICGAEQYAGVWVYILNILHIIHFLMMCGRRPSQNAHASVGDVGYIPIVRYIEHQQKYNSHHHQTHKPPATTTKNGKKINCAETELIRSGMFMFTLLHSFIVREARASDTFRCG